MKTTNFWLNSILILVAIALLNLSGCSNTPANSSAGDRQSIAQVETTAADNSSLNMYKDLPRLNGMATVELVVNGSPIVIEVYGNEAPITAGNFVDLVQKGVYDGLAFHRVIDGFVAQGGDPQSKDPNFRGTLGTGGYIDPQTNRERTIPLEIRLEGESEPTYNQAANRQRNPVAPPVTLKHEAGAVAMARSQAPDSASSQFYITLGEQEFLDGDYAVFGKVVEGMDVVENIQQGDRIESAKVIKGEENLQSAEG